MGGDGAMLDIGFQNLSRLLASGKPIRVVVLDTQVYSNTGGQACTSGFTGQVADMAAYGTAQHGKTEMRKELALIAIAHRGAYVHQTSQASPAHLIGGVLRALAQAAAGGVQHLHAVPGRARPRRLRRSPRRRLALESRAPSPSSTTIPTPARPSPTASASTATRPEAALADLQAHRPRRGGRAAQLELPLTIADWAATEARFEHHFRALADDRSTAAVPFHEYVEMGGAERRDKLPFLWTRSREGSLGRLEASSEMVALAEDRQSFWSLLRELAGQPIGGPSQ